jgi:hypothetical protein
MISQSIASGRITVNAREFVAYPFSVPAACKQAMVQGDFETAVNVVLGGAVLLRSEQSHISPSADRASQTESFLSNAVTQSRCKSLNL